MRKWVLTSLALSLSSAVCLSSPGAATETDQFGTPDADDVTTIAVRGAEVLIGGSTKGDLFPGGAQGNFDAYIRRACIGCQGAPGDSCDTTITQFGTPAKDFLMSIAMGPDGEVYCAGKTDGDLGLPLQEISPAPGETEAFLRRYEIGPDGSFIDGWGWEVQTPENDEMLAIAALDARVYVAGATGGDLVTGDGISAGGEDAFVRAYDRASGALLGTLQIGTDKIEEIFSIVVTESSLFAAGMTRGNLSGVPANAHYGQDEDGAVNDAFVARIDPVDLTLDWIYQFGSNGRSDAAQDLALADGALFVVGRQGQDDAVMGCQPDSTADWNDGFALRIDLTVDDQPVVQQNGGLVRWGHRFGTCLGDGAAACAIAGNRLFVVGAIRGPLDHETPVATEDGIVLEYALAYSGPPAPENTNLISTPQSDRAKDVAWDGECLHVAGTTYGDLAGSQGGADAFWRRYSVATGIQMPTWSAETLVIASRPQPARGAATIRFSLPASDRAQLSVHDTTGRRIRMLLDARLPTGEQGVQWDGRDEGGRTVPAGVYFARLMSGPARGAARIVLIR